MNKVLTACITLVLAGTLGGCNLPGSAATEPPLQIQTSAALTVQAVLNSTPLPSPTLQTPVPQAPGATAPAGSTSTVTPSHGEAKLTVEDVTNCRKGPGLGYEQVAQIAAGQEVNIIGSYPNFWIVQTDQGSCWIATEFSTPSGNVAKVPTVTAPPTSTAGKPNAPGIQKWDYVCTGMQAEISIRWTDRTDNETGYRIYMNGNVLTELPANSTQYSTKVLLQSGQNASFYVEAFNATGSASSSTFTITC